MQQFFFICTMLIVSEGFPEDLSESAVPKNFEKKLVSKPTYSSTGHLMSGDVNLPTFFVPYFYKAPFLVPLKGKHGNHNPWQRASSKRKRFRKQFLRKRKWTPKYPRYMTGSLTLSTPGYLENPSFPSGLHRDYFDSLSALTENRNQYPVLQSNKGALNPYKKRRLSTFEMRYLDSLRNKNKRNANNGNDKENNEEKKAGDKETSQKSDSQGHTKVKQHVEENTTVGEIKENAGNRNLKQKSGSDSSAESESDYPEEKSSSDSTEPSTEGLKGHCEPMKHQSALRSEGTSFLDMKKVSETENLTDESEDSSSHIGKLKEMLEQVQSLLKSDFDKNDEKVKPNKEDISSVKSDKPKSVNSLKDKIDTAIPILKQISEDLMKISNSSNSSAKHSEKVPTRCNPDGIWSSEEGGLDLTIKTLPNMMLKVSVSNSKTEGIINKKWSIQGLTLSREGGPLILAAVYPQKRKIACFIGQCKICKDQDIIFGSWSTFTFVHKYTDLWKAVDYKLDVLKKKTTGN